MDEIFGFPRVTATNIFEVLRELGIKPWDHERPTMSLEEYIASDLTEEQRGELKFAPKSEVVFLKQPNGHPFTGFRSVGKNWATTFALLPGRYVPIVAEWKHGTEQISLVPPSGVMNKSDSGSWEACAKREFEEETGMVLESVESLTGNQPLGVSSRQSTMCFYPFLGNIDGPHMRGQSKLDVTEHLKLVVISLGDWLSLIEGGWVLDQVGITTTYLALRRLHLLREA
ncbi:MAG: NUDIX domain-containing protein [Candidatus Kerfeldbacteria bacterium]|nr:NUDIX domain-containing protein [Candidatus Kerfeldbacteria bacterium]